MSDGDRYHSIPERITWTAGFRVATDKHILGVLSTFASFKTGRGARMSIPALVARAGLPQRTVERALHRLEVDRWIVARRRHRHATAWDINVDQLATSWGGSTKMVTRPDTNLTATYGGQENLSATGDALTATSGGQDADLTATSGGPIPCTSDPLSDHKGTGTTAVQLSLPPQDVGPETPRFDAAALRAKLAALPALDVTGRRKRSGTG